MSQRLSNSPDIEFHSMLESDEVNCDSRLNRQKQYEYTCTTCFRDHNDSEAIIFCKTCKDYLCSKCKQWHAKYNSDHDDKLIGQTKMKMLGDQPTTLMPVERCGHHPGEVLHVFCQQHCEAVCKKCKEQTHSSCQGVIPRCTVHIETARVQMSTPNVLSNPVVQTISNIPGTSGPLHANTSQPIGTPSHSSQAAGEDVDTNFENIRNDRNEERRHTFQESRKAKVFVNVMTFFAVVLIAFKIVFGGLHMDNCDIEYRIPIYLVVPLNIFGFTAVICCFYWNTKWQRSEMIATLIAISGLLSLSWQIVGTVFVFPHVKTVLGTGCETLRNDNNNTMTELCCDLNTFRLAFGVTIVDWIVVALFPVILFAFQKSLN